MKGLFTFVLVALTMGAPFQATNKQLPAQQDTKQPDAKQIAEAVDRHYNALHSLASDFIHTVKGNGTDKAESGHLLLLRPGRMRWEYTTPRSKIFIVDSKNAWFYVPDDHQVRHSSAKQLDDLRSPLRLLLGHSQIAKEFEGLQIDTATARLAQENILLTGVPKHDLGEEASRVWLEVTPERRLTRLIVEQEGGGRVEFRFSNIREDLKVDDALFHFTPPKGVEIIEEQAPANP